MIYLSKTSMKRLISWILLLALIPASLFFPASVYAQADELTLDLSRDFGYSSGTGRIQGTFSMRVKGPSNLIRVEFLIDNKVIGEAKESPFRFQFKTDAYPLGVHTLSATGYSSGGKIASSNEIRVEFVSAEEGTSLVLKIILPIFALIFIVSAVSILIPTLTKRRSKSTVPLGSPRSYGTFGGAICPKCKRPFSIHIFGFNLLIGKLDRCPHCGRWSLVRRAYPDELRLAELAELNQNQEVEKEAVLSEDEKLKKELEESRYQDI